MDKSMYGEALRQEKQKWFTNSSSVLCICTFAQEPGSWLFVLFCCCLDGTNTETHMHKFKLILKNLTQTKNALTIHCVHTKYYIPHISMDAAGEESTLSWHWDQKMWHVVFSDNMEDSYLWIEGVILLELHRDFIKKI